MPGGFQFLPHEQGAILNQILMLASERGREVTVNVQFADDFAMSKHRHYNLRFRFERTRQVARIFADIVDHNSLSARRRCPANALIQGMRVCGVIAPSNAPRTSIGGCAPGSSM